MNNQTEHIKQLLDRYMDGSESQQDLKELREYFCHTKDLPADWEVYRDMFEVETQPYGIPSVESLQHLAKQGDKKRSTKVWPWIAAACVAGWLVICLKPPRTDTPDVPQMAKVEQPTKPVKTTADAPKVSSPASDTSTESKDATSLKEEKVLTSKEETPVQVVPLEERMVPIQEVNLPAKEPTVILAAQTQKAEEEEQDPSKADAFIARLAAWSGVSPVNLDCQAPEDSAEVSYVYVFPDKEDLDLMGKLMQMACCYSSDTPGYFLNFTNRQFFFQLKDEQQHLIYLWQAERIQGAILLYGVHAPTGKPINSVCYRKYREELMAKKQYSL